MSISQQDDLGKDIALLHQVQNTLLMTQQQRNNNDQQSNHQLRQKVKATLFQAQQ